MKALAEPDTLSAQVEALIAQVAAYSPNADLSIIRRAYELGAEAHDGQFRASGEPYIIHPLAAARILADMQLDVAAIAAAILHDVPEDTDVPLSRIEELFGDEVALLVDGVTKLSRVSWDSLEEEQAENLRKMFLAMARDIRVVLIKLADRLHNMRTLNFLKPQKQQKIARETMEIFAPLAHRLGIWQIKWELEDLAFYYLEPERYREIARLLARKRSERERYIRQAVGMLKAELERAGIEAEISGRPKHIYSIYKKLQRRGVDFEHIYDLMAVRVLVRSRDDCYGALGVIHSLWRPIPGRFKDHVANPKPNGYQSLHTTVFCFDGQPLEVQVRTHEMHRVSEYGVAAHWRYKEGEKRDREFESKLAWLRQLMDWQKELPSAEDFMESVKMDVFQDQVFVFTPKGAIKDLPAGSTPVDFAYRIHTDVGNGCIGAKVNGRLVPLEYKLENGDIVEILTTRKPQGPSRDWLGFVRTAGAREKIRQWFKRQEREDNIARGRDLLDRELRRLEQKALGSLSLERLEQVAQDLHFKDVNDFFAAIGYGAVTTGKVVAKLFPREQEAPAIPELGSAAPPAPARRSLKVGGVGDLLTRLAPCCNPLPGEEIVGYITRGKGITVHRVGCPNTRSEDEQERLVHGLEWKAEEKARYPVTLRIQGWDREGLLRDVATVVADEKLSLRAASATTHRDQTATITASVDVTDLVQLSQLFSKLEKVKDVYAVEREFRPSN